MPSSDRKSVGSEEHTSELQSHSHLVCRLLLEKNIRERVKRELAVFMCDHLASGQATSHPEHPRARRARPRRRQARHSVYLPGYVFFLKKGAPPDFYPFPQHAASPT